MVITLPPHDERFIVEVVVLARREIDLWESHLAKISLFDDDGNHNVRVVTSVPAFASFPAKGVTGRLVEELVSLGGLASN